METILIIEDDAKLASLLSTYLSKYEFRTVIVEDFNRVLEIFNESAPDLVLLDVNLPNTMVFIGVARFALSHSALFFSYPLGIVEWIR